MSSSTYCMHYSLLKHYHPGYLIISLDQRMNIMYQDKANIIMIMRAFRRTYGLFALHGHYSSSTYTYLIIIIDIAL